MRALVPYAGSDSRVARPRAAIKINGRPPKLVEKLSPFNEDRALRLLRNGHDNVSIAWLLACTPAAAANGLHEARERERIR